MFPARPMRSSGLPPPRPSLGNGAEIPREHVAPHRMSMTGDPDKTAQTTRAQHRNEGPRVRRIPTPFK